MTRPRFTGLWRRADFLRFWGAQTISLFGSEVTYLALPLLAALTLGASPAEMGVLTAAGTLPYLAFGLVAGVWVDRLRRRALMVAAEVGCALVLLSVPLTALLGVLRLEQLYAVALLTGAFDLLFGAADNAYLPSLLRREEFMEGNSKLAMTTTLSEERVPGSPASSYRCSRRRWPSYSNGHNGFALPGARGEAELRPYTGVNLSDNCSNCAR